MPFWQNGDLHVTRRRRCWEGPALLRGLHESRSCPPFLSFPPPSADIWSLGVILYMLVCGQPPFQEANDSETLTMILDCRYVIPPSVSSQCAEYGMCSPPCPRLEVPLYRQGCAGLCKAPTLCSFWQWRQTCAAEQEGQHNHPPRGPVNCNPCPHILPKIKCCSSSKCQAWARGGERGLSRQVQLKGLLL